MNDKMMHWQGTDLIVTPNRCYVKNTIRIIIVGVMFLCLGIYLAIRYQDFWQLPLATGGCLVFPALLYKFFSADIQLYIPAGKAAVSMSFGGYFKHTLIDKNEVQIVQNTLNGKPYMAIASKNNPYGRSYQISPFLTSAHKDKLYNENILPVIKQQLLS